MSSTTTFESRIDFSPLVAGLAIGDLVAITAFVVAGQISHGFSPLVDVGRFAGTLTPFLVGWSLTAFAAGLYTRDAISTARRVLSLTVPAWIIAVVIAQLLRGTPAFPGNAALTFALVAAGFGGAILVGWRLAVAIALNRHTTG